MLHQGGVAVSRIISNLGVKLINANIIKVQLEYSLGTDWSH